MALVIIIIIFCILTSLIQKVSGENYHQFVIDCNTLYVPVKADLTGAFSELSWCLWVQIIIFSVVMVGMLP